MWPIKSYQTTCSGLAATAAVGAAGLPQARYLACSRPGQHECSERFQQSCCSSMRSPGSIMHHAWDAHASVLLQQRQCVLLRASQGDAAATAAEKAMSTRSKRSKRRSSSTGSSPHQPAGMHQSQIQELTPAQHQRQQRQQQQKQQKPMEHQLKPQPAPKQQQRQKQQHGGIPPEEVWCQELRHMQGLLADPHKPLLRQFVLRQCYVLNSTDTQQQFRQLSAASMSNIAKDRQRVEAGLSRASHSLSTSWRRLQLMCEGLCEAGAAATDDQLAKERQLLVDIRDRLVATQRLHARSVTRAAELGDAAYLPRSRALGQLLQEATEAVESYLRPGMANIAAASRVNSTFRNAWLKTSPARRPPPAVAESQRQSQLAPLLPLLPGDGPVALLDRYKRAAMTFQLHRDNALLQRPPANGLPRSTGGVFWQDSCTQDMIAVTPPWPQGAPGAAAAGASGGDDGQMELPGAEQADVNSAVVLQDKEQASTGAPQQQQQQQQGDQLSSLQPPLRLNREAAWEQPSLQQLMARPVQQLPLLPHLAKPWVRQQTMMFRQQQQQEHKQQQLKQLDRIGWPGGVSSRDRAKTYGQGYQGAMPSPQEVQGASTAAAAAGQSISLSGRVLPPLPVLLQRALAVEEQLVGRKKRE